MVYSSVSSLIYSSWVFEQFEVRSVRDLDVIHVNKKDSYAYSVSARSWYHEGLTFDFKKSFHSNT